MGSHIVHSYDKELNHVITLIVEMGELVRELIAITEKSLKDPSPDLLTLARTTDKKVNHLDAEIERHAISILALRQPMAVDLRITISALRLTVIMERMGDLAKNTVKRTGKIDFPIEAATMEKISRMTDMISGMLEDALTAFQEKDLQKTRQVVMRDGEVDEIYRQLMEELQQSMQQQPSSILSALQIIFAVRNIERIGDYASKTANIFHYIVSGEKLNKKNILPAEENILPAEDIQEP